VELPVQRRRCGGEGRQMSIVIDTVQALINHDYELTLSCDKTTIERWTCRNRGIGSASTIPSCMTT
jgi:hypothetical protein